MEHDLGSGDIQLKLKGSHEIQQGAQLRFGECAAFAIPDQADPDRLAVECVDPTLLRRRWSRRGGDVRAGPLPVPTRRRFHHAIAQSGTVSDHEVVPEFIETGPTCFCIEFSDGARHRPGIMDHNVVPPLLVDPRIRQG